MSGEIKKTENEEKADIAAKPTTELSESALEQVAGGGIVLKGTAHGTHIKDAIITS